MTVAGCLNYGTQPLRHMPIHSPHVLGLYWFASTATTKYHRLGSLNNRNLFPYSSVGWKSKINVLAGLVSSERPLRWLVDGCLPSVPAHGLLLFVCLS